MASRIDLSDRVAVVTGASRGIGRACAITFAEAGAHVVLSAREAAALEETAASIRAAGGTCSIVAGDLADPAFVEALMRGVLRDHGRLDVLLNNAGALSDGLMGMIKPEQMSASLQVNLVAAIQASHLAARLMTRRRSGSIINMSSIMGVQGAAGQTVYAAGKAGLIGLTKSAAKELAPSGVRVNAIAPGLIDTDMLSGLTEEKKTERIASVSMRRAGTPDEVADVALFLASDLSRYVTGQVIGVDGGMII